MLTACSVNNKGCEEEAIITIFSSDVFVAVAVAAASVSSYIGDGDGMATYGNVEEFKESDESWTQYAVRHKQYFAANEIKDAKKP